MERSSAPSSESKPTAIGASKFLAGLPSSGLFSSTVISSNLGGMRVYITDHETSPPAVAYRLVTAVYVKGAWLETLFAYLMRGSDLSMSVYPEDQLIKTNQDNILIRSLVLKQQKGESSSKGAKGTAANEGSKKRPAERMDGRASAKRPVSNTQSSSRQEGSKSRLDFQTLTVERLRALLKEKGLSPKGKKDELVSRLRGATG